jgi:hypothetical protein
MGSPGRVVTLAVVGILAASAAPSGAQGLFSEVPPAASREASPRLGVVRSRPVSVRLGLIPGAARGAPRGVLPPPGHRLTLNLFDDVAVRARMTRAERRGRALVWTGKIEGEAVGDVVLAVVDGVLSGSAVWPRGGAYRVRFDGATHVVEQLDHGLFPDGGCFKEAPGAPAEAPVVSAEDGSQIDVLVVYTPAARAAAGGPSAMVSAVNLAVAETNAGYANSNVVQRLRLAGAVEVSYAESGDIAADLDRLTAPGDGFLDGVHALRDTYRADLVSLVTETPSSPYCGVAWLMSGNDPGFAPNAFSVVELACLTGYYSFGHELGHNMGLNHARQDYSYTPVGAFPYSFGYKNPSHLFRTVMAYNCPVSCPRVLHFSNPNVTYGGNPTGVSEASPGSAHNALSLDNTRVTVANWRQSLNPSIRVDAPNGGEAWPAGSTQAIAWTASDLPAGAVVRIIFSDGSGGFVTNRAGGGAIASVPASQGSYDWEVPFEPGGSWRVKLCVPAPASPVRGSPGGPPCLASDTSDAPFSIVP